MRAAARCEKTMAMAWRHAFFFFCFVLVEVAAASISWADDDEEDCRKNGKPNLLVGLGNDLLCDVPESTRTRGTGLGRKEGNRASVGWVAVKQSAVTRIK